MNPPVAVLDACSLVPIRLATTLLWLAEAGLFQPLWSPMILDEVERNLPKLGVSPEAAARRVAMMTAAFGPEASVDRFEELVDSMACHPKDRHVLAAAVRGGADVVVTFNVKDFPQGSAGEHGIEVVHPDPFLVSLLRMDAASVVTALKSETATFRHPPATVLEFLSSLTAAVPAFANLAADAVVDPPGPVSPVPALVMSDDAAGLAVLGEPGDISNPAQVALMWWAAVYGNLELARALTFEPRAWGDYQPVTDQLDGWSLASKVLRAVDAPDRVAFMRFVPEVSTAARVFEAYRTPMMFVTLVKLDDDTWRVWGLGQGIQSARTILKS